MIGVKLLEVVGWTQRSGVGLLTKPSKQTANCVGPGVTGGVLWSWQYSVQRGLVTGRVGAWWPGLDRLMRVRPGCIILVCASIAIVGRWMRN